jgi:AraC-like DNA-binding protein
MRAMDYREYPVPEPLRRHIACVWRLRDDEPAGSPQTIYPDGRCELLVHLASPPECWEVAGWHRQSTTLFAAQRATAVRLRATQALDCVGLRLCPAASGLLGRLALAKHRDRVVDLAGVDRAFSRNLRAAVREFARGNDAKLWRLMASACSLHELDARIEAAAARLESSAGRTRIDAAARTAGMSIRGFQIRFRECVGTTPKEFARLMRLQATLRALDGDSSLSGLAADAGFSDQAHVTRELRRVTGLTPARLRAELRRDREGDAAVRLAAAFVRGHAASSGR